MTGGSPCGIAVGPAYAYYLTDTGSSFKIVRTGLGAPGPIVDTFTATPTGDCGLAFGPDQRLYWTNGGFNSSGTSGLWSVGNEPTSPPSFLAPTEPEPWSVAVDGTYAYWTTYKGHKLNRVRVDGTASPETVILAGIADESVGLAVDNLPLPPAEPPPPGGGSEPSGGGASGGGSSGSTTPPPTPTTTAPRKPKPPVCKKGTRRKKVKGKARCVRVKKHKHRHRHRGH
jgi:hypothetical protein